MLTAPAGYGKSTLLAQWAAQDARPFIWLQLMPTDDNPRILTQRITAAVATLRFTGAHLPPLSTVDQDGHRARIDLADLLDQVSSSFVVVLDDAHHLDAPASSAVVDTLRTHLPPGSQLAIAGRHAAPLGVRRWRAEFDILEIVAGELAFTPPETLQVLGSATAAAPSWCGGWPAAVSIAATVRSGVSGPFDPHSRLADVLGQYLESEVLDGLSEHDLIFLTRSAVLDVMTPGACRAVVGEPSTPRDLAGLHVAIPLVTFEKTRDTTGGSTGDRYRCHPLLRQALLARLDLREPDVRPTLHLRAARWFAGTGDQDSALDHALRADDMDYFGQLVWPLVRPTSSAAELDRFQTILDTVSAAQARRSPHLVVAAAWAAFLSGRLPEMDRWLSLSEVDTRRAWLSDVSAAEHRGALALLLAWTCRGDISQVLDLSSTAFDGLPATSAWRAAAGVLSGLALEFSGRTAEAQDRLHLAATLADALGDQLTRADALAALAAKDSGRPTRVSNGELLEMAGNILAGHEGSSRALSTYTTSVLAEYLARAGSQREATRMLARARTSTVAATGLAPWLRIHAMVRQSTAALMLGDATAARQLVRGARLLVDDLPTPPSRPDVVTQAESRLAALPADPAFGLSPFTAAERRILRLLPTHLSYVEMGLLLSVSRHTVKTQALAVYRKLGAVSRHDAVERACSMGFFDPIGVPEWVPA